MFQKKYIPQFLLLSLFIVPVISFAQPLIKQDRLERRIVELAKYGLREDGTTERVAFSDADIEARKWVMNTMVNLGLKTHIDFAGNIIGTRPGEGKDKKPISFGSHIDRVPQGGNYDGCLGSMAALEIIETLNENGIRTIHPLEVIIFSNEEGGVMGSRALSGHLSPKAFSIKNATGYTMGEGIMRLGGDTTKIDQVKRKKGDITAFVELHIEQGGILEKEDIDIGIVEGIVGLKWWDVEFIGFANHAGTTPMNARQDALLAAAKFIVAVNETTTSFEGQQVGTVGRITAAPGAPNVIPGKVMASLEIRDLSSKRIGELFNAIQKRTDEIAKASNVAITFHPLDTTADPALMDTVVQDEIKNAAAALGLSTRKMPSGAGHDAQDMATLAPTGMIFVPSKGGISHSPKEFTSARDMAQGANVLLRTLMALDQKME